MYENKTIFNILNIDFFCIIKFSGSHHTLWSGHTGYNFFFFFLVCAECGYTPCECRENRNELWSCTMKVVTEFVIPVACQSSCSLTVSCHTASISHRCRILMGDPFFTALFLIFCLYNTFIKTVFFVFIFIFIPLSYANLFTFVIWNTSQEIRMWIKHQRPGVLQSIWVTAESL